MVSFSCEVCNETLLKKKLMGHLGRCPQAVFTCIDCYTTFPGTEFQKHTQCITEDQKYQGKLFQPKNGQQAKAQAQVAATKQNVEKKSETPKTPPETHSRADGSESATQPEVKASKKARNSVPSKETVKVGKKQNLGHLLKKLRKEHKLDKHQLLEKLEVSPDGKISWV